MTLIAPVAVEEQTLYRPVTGSADIVFASTRTDLPVKEHFFPSTHVLFTARQGEDGLRLEEPPVVEERAVFGLRPCDARALQVLDALFVDEEPVDPYYAERRAKTALIGVACQQVGPECFCTSLGLSPDETEDVDLMLTEMKGGYAVQAVTGVGEALLDGLVLHEGEGPLPKLASKGRVPVLEAEGWPAHFDSAYWARLADRCLSCRLCTYLCPTCRCFDVRDDEGTQRDITRLRAWDSCMAEGYRRIAGGHNPRPEKAQRLRNRLYCKFCYYPRDFGLVACVGCGRCIAKCPVNVDVAEALGDIAAL
jgi:ferredoxin